MEIRELTWKFMLKNQISDFRIKLEDIKTLIIQNGWHLFSYNESEELIEQLDLQTYCKTRNGFTYVLQGKKTHYMIFYKDELSYTMKTFVLLHEIGHIVLNHTYIGGIFGQGKSTVLTNQQEKEADIFALEFMAPSCLLQPWHINTVDKIKFYHLIPNAYVEQYVLAMHKTKPYTTRLGIKMRWHYHHVHYDLLTKFSRIASSIILCLFIAFIFSFSYLGFRAATHPPSSSVSSSFSSAQEIVYVTQTGKRYHRATCPHIQGHTTIRLTRKQAKERHLTPCLTCQPDQEKFTK